MKDQRGEQFAQWNLRLASGAAAHRGRPRAAEQLLESRDKPQMVALARLARTGAARGAARGAAEVLDAGFVAMLLLGMFRHPKCKQLYIRIVQHINQRAPVMPDSISERHCG